MSVVKTPTKSSERRASRGRTGEGGANPVDIHVGNRVRLRRTLLGLSQESLGEALGLTFQQVQKYERGANRIGASRLFDLARVLGVPVTYFYEEMSVIKREKSVSWLYLSLVFPQQFENSCGKM